MLQSDFISDLRPPQAPHETQHPHVLHPAPQPNGMAKKVDNMKFLYLIFNFNLINYSYEVVLES